ncbi:MAG: 50S ribosomal protein L20 [Deltaproteobacteria bacterium]|nr:50S ribosomal protein L20 [Candidatus Anaeroferrophillacea bacterium]
MPRTKGGFTTRRRHKKILKRAGGYRGGRGTLFRSATETVDRALNYAYRDRRVRKREFRALWITRINAAAREHGISYSRLMNGLNLANIDIDRKILADIALNDPSSFGKIVSLASSALGN